VPKNKEAAVTLHIPLPPETEARLRQRAKAVGQDLEAYAAHLLDEAARKPPLDDVFAPSRRAFEESGMTEDQLGDLLEDAKHRRREARRTGSA
jgi:hypothetical protein